jgi:two-component system sensor histidine kinase HydH
MANGKFTDRHWERGGVTLAGLVAWGSLCCGPVETILAKALGQDASQLAAAEKRDLLARLLGRLAHEVRNPLSSLDIHVQLLEEDLASLAPQMREQLTPRLEIIHGELHRLEGIVERFLRLAGPAGVDLEPVEIPKILTHVCELLRPEAAARDIEISAQVEDSLPRVMADPIRLTQALLNLVINAIQAVERKGRVEVTANVADGRVSVTVSDNGPGIPPEKLASIFDPYFTTKTEGSGLGLWIAQQIVTAHGGSLEARNGASGGAVVTMQLPLDHEVGSSVNNEDTKARSNG